MGLDPKPELLTDHGESDMLNDSLKESSEEPNGCQRHSCTGMPSDHTDLGACCCYSCFHNSSWASLCRFRERSLASYARDDLAIIGIENLDT
jgi:hypothetical protein